MQLSIIIVNFNTVNVTIDCLQSLLKHLTSAVSYEVILIDNAPKADNSSTFRRIIPGLVYLRSDTNIGFGRANNMGMEIARGEYYLLLNSDTIVFDGSIQNCLAFMNEPENSHVGLLGCRLLNEDLSYQASFYPFAKNKLYNFFISNNPVLYKIFSASKAFKPPFRCTKVGDVSGAFMLLRRKVFVTVKGFDPDFFLYCEETEWCRNRISKQFDIVYYPGAAIIHLGGKSAPSELMCIQAQLSLALYWYKTGIFHYFFYNIYTYLNAIFFLAQYSLAKSAGRQNIRRYLSGLWRIQKYIYLDIPWHSSKFGSRKNPLILDEAKSVYFE